MQRYAFSVEQQQKSRGTFHVFLFFYQASTKKGKDSFSFPFMWVLTNCFQRTVSSLCGRWRIRTADPLLVRQTLWTSWAKRPLLVGMTRLERATPWSQTKYTTNCTTSRFHRPFSLAFLKKHCKGTAFIWIDKGIRSFFYFQQKKRVQKWGASKKTRPIIINTV